MITVNSNGHSDTLATCQSSVWEVSCFRFRVFDRALDMKQAAVIDSDKDGSRAYGLQYVL
jgi:hypothetical protein